MIYIYECVCVFVCVCVCVFLSVYVCVCIYVAVACSLFTPRNSDWGYVPTPVSSPFVYFLFPFFLGGGGVWFANACFLHAKSHHELQNYEYLSVWCNLEWGSHVSIHIIHKHTHTHTQTHTHTHTEWGHISLSICKCMSLYPCVLPCHVSVSIIYACVDMIKRHVSPPTRPMWRIPVHVPMHAWTWWKGLTHHHNTPNPGHPAL